MTYLFGLTIFLSALLLFSVQPMVGKMILPRFGGTPAVWNTCMVVYQTLLLAGYAYGHFSCRWLGVRRQSVLHLVVIALPLLVLPITFSENLLPPSESNPTWWLIGQIVLAVSLPFFVISSTAPLLQRWLTFGRGDRDPYFLYAISNAGSLLALLGYPLLLEPALAVENQSALWGVTYIAFAVLMLACVVQILRSTRGKTSDPDARAVDDHRGLPPIPAWQRLRWVVLSLVPCSLMLGVTTYVTTEIASAPLLWVLPLVIYLLTFILVFARRAVLPHSLALRIFPFVVLLMSLLLFADLQQKQWLMFPFHMVGFFVVAMVCHGELARTRPPGPQLTEFYLWMGVGGAIGGVINGVIAPIAFDSIVEYPAMLVVACFLVPRMSDETQKSLLTRRDAAWLGGLAISTLCLITLIESFDVKGKIALLGAMGLPALVCFGFKDRPVRFAIGFVIILVGAANMARLERGRELYARRGFFGVNRVTVDDSNRFHRLINGRTYHGIQQMLPEPSREPLAYYHRTGPVGDVFRSLSPDLADSHIAVVGLGAGTLASYVQPQQNITFFEIDPVVRDIATDPELFTFIDGCQGIVRIVMGDARLKMQSAADESFGILVIDAFSSDSIPAHLLTNEAFELYLSKLRHDGLIVFHISNKYLRIEPLLAAVAQQQGLVGLARFDDLSGDPEPIPGKKVSHYVVLARESQHLGGLLTDHRWTAIEGDPGIRYWTDGYSNLLSLFIW